MREITAYFHMDGMIIGERKIDDCKNIVMPKIRPKEKGSNLKKIALDSNMGRSFITVGAKAITWFH